MSNRFSIYPATLDLDGGTTFVHLRQLERYRFEPNAQKSAMTPGGALDPQHIGLATAKPKHEAATRDLAGVLAAAANFATIGLNVAGQANWRFQQRACESTFKSTASHIHRLSNAGLWVPETLSCSEEDREGALLVTNFYSISTDGLTDPDTKVGSVDFSAVQTPLFNSRFYMGPVRLGGTKLQGVDRVTIDYGLTVNSKTFDGIYPTCCTIDARNPSVTFGSSNCAIDAALGQFINNASAGFEFYLRKGSHGQGRVAAGTASHYKCTVAAGEWSIDEESASGQADAENSFTVRATGTIAEVANSTVPT